MSKPRGPRLTVPEHCHPWVKWLCEEMNRQQRTLGEVSEKAGLGRNTISEWRTRGSPTLTSFEAVVNVLGYEIDIRPMAAKRDAA